jgi:hypothetical protein
LRSIPLKSDTRNEKNFGASPRPIQPPCHAEAIKSGQRAKHRVVLMHKLLIPILAAAALAGNPCSSQADDAAQDKPSKTGELITVSSWLMEVGGRYLTSAGKDNWEAFSTSHRTQFSGLTDGALTTDSADAFWHVDPASAALAKGLFGGGLMISSHLRHANLPPVIRLYATPLSKPEQSSPTDAVVSHGYAVWTIPHYPLVAFVADPRWREQGAAFASTVVTNNPDHCFTAPISPAVTVLGSDATRQSLRLWCGGAVCSYTPPEAFGRCGASLELSQHR